MLIEQDDLRISDHYKRRRPESGGAACVSSWMHRRLV
jgi:hypothetical protein